jgi:hypothetical protein
MRYRWEIKTSDTWYSGTDARVFVSLSGLDASMREVQISDPDAINDWEKGDVNHGSIETEDLGELQTGTLRHDQSGPASGWSVDWVKITSEEDGREWTATVGGFDTGGRFPLLRFSRSNDGQYEQAKKLKAKRAADAAAKESSDKLAARRQAAEQESSSNDAALDDELVKKQRDLDRELRRAQAEAKIAEQRAKLDTLRSGGATPSGGSTAGSSSFRTYELFGNLNGANVPLNRVVRMDGSTGRYAVVPGGRVLVGEAPGEGFGSGGTPGRWSAFYSDSPAQYGLDADKAVLASDGTRGWAVTAEFLSQVFGAGWRTAIYS